MKEFKNEPFKMTLGQEKEVKKLFLKYHSKMYSNGEFGMVMLSKSFSKAFEEFLSTNKL